MLKMIKGCKVNDTTVLNEGYEITDYGFVANIDAGKIQALFESFVKLHNDMCFLVLEVPTNAKEETAFSSDGASALHKDVYYLDGLTPDRAIEFLDVFVVLHANTNTPVINITKRYFKNLLMKSYVVF
jgi:hypothetical protein